MNIPEAAALPGLVSNLPFVIVADDASSVDAKYHETLSGSNLSFEVDNRGVEGDIRGVEGTSEELRGTPLPLVALHCMLEWEVVPQHFLQCIPC
ncbi:hypothetical protein TNIN_256341 [Trichonephila inaurata madagascariensis]|uniref:Uncharacterized protein n=1 Tax=Trichonephila inaurata madagascariensis TaxID=2747483 RepID=A0A8X6X8I5_9ARAC|nr:hypothetical protein TNIN_256341 [Trichonephila inaurata madagascariensis]